MNLRPHIARGTILGSALAAFAAFRPVPAPARERTCPPADKNHRYLSVPIDYKRPDKGQFQLYYEVSDGFDSSKPTVMITGDAQGSPSAIGLPNYQKQRIGADVNFVAVGHRGMECSKIPGMAGGKATDWIEAYRIFGTDNVVEDIDRVRRDLLGNEGRMLTLGGSGNGILSFQYLAKFGRYVTRAFIYNATPSIVALNRDEGDNLARIMEAHGVNKHRFRRLLDSGGVSRRQLIWNLTKTLAATKPDSGEVKALVSDLESGRTTSFGNLTKQYLDVDKIFPLLEAEPVIAVRFFEIYPDGAAHALPERLSSYLFADLVGPLRKLADRGAITPKPIDLWSEIGHLDTEVFLVAGRWDATIPFTEMVSTAERIPNSRLVVLNTTHLFAGNRPCAFGLMKAFFAAQDAEELLDSPECDVWAKIGFGRKPR